MNILIYKGGKSNDSLKRLLNDLGIVYDLTPLKEAYDYIVKPPGVKKEEIKVKGQIICDIEFVYSIFHFLSYAVTGSCGKSTCVMLIYHLLKDKYKCRMCGNIGIPISDVIDKNKQLYILEISSFQLDSIITYKPRISVILNVREAHLDYHLSMENYIEAKGKITINQDKNDFIIYNADDENATYIAKKSNAIKLSISLNKKNADAYYFNNCIYTRYGKINLKDSFSALEGDIYNIMAAVLVALLSNIDISFIEKKLKTFKKPRYRMEQIRSNVYNDAKSTNIHSTLTQIKNMSDISLICGGYDRGNSLDDILKIAPHVRMFYLYGENRIRVGRFLDDYNIDYKSFDRLNEALQSAMDGYSTIVYSPMAPSYDQFNSFEERGQLFDELIKKYLPE